MRELGSRKGAEFGLVGKKIFLEFGKLLRTVSIPLLALVNCHREMWRPQNHLPLFPLPWDGRGT